MPSKKWEKLRDKLSQASTEKDVALRGVKIAAVISDALKEIGLDPILVGVSAVAFYTEGRYTTADIDMVAPSGKDVTEVMANLGFSRLGKDYTNKKLGIYVEFPGEALGPTERANVIEIDRVLLRIISQEDLIIDRLCAYKFWGSVVDGVNALIVLEIGGYDLARLENRAREEDVLDALDYIGHTLETITRKKLPKTEATELLKKFCKKN